MNPSIAEETGSAQAPVAGEKPKPIKKARVAPLGAHVANKKATPPKKAPKGAKKGDGARAGSKTAKVLELLKRPGTAKELIKATGWLPHSVREFLSGTLGKKMALTVESTKRDDGERTYWIAK